MPASSVVMPVVVPGKTTLTNCIGVPSAASVTRPRTRVLCAGRTVGRNRTAMRKASGLYVIFRRSI